MSVRRHEQQTRTSDSGHGFWLFGFLSVALAVLKLTVAGYWSWWRVMLPFLAFLGHNAVYLLIVTLGTVSVRERYPQLLRARACGNVKNLSLLTGYTVGGRRPAVMNSFS